MTYTWEKPAAASFQEMQWKNGQGSTLELAKFPDDADLGKLDFLWRLSVATISTSGPFSSFTGFDRHIALLSGPSPILQHQIDDVSTEVILTPLTPHLFPGEWTTTCELPEDSSPCRDFNVMSKRDEIAATVDALKVEGEQKLTLASRWHFFYVAIGAAQLTLGQETTFLRTGDLLQLVRTDAKTAETVATANLAGTGSRVLHVRLDPLFRN